MLCRTMTLTSKPSYVETKQRGTDFGRPAVALRRLPFCQRYRSVLRLLQAPALPRSVAWPVGSALTVAFKLVCDTPAQASRRSSQQRAPSCPGDRAWRKKAAMCRPSSGFQPRRRPPVARLPERERTAARPRVASAARVEARGVWSAQVPALTPNPNPNPNLSPSTNPDPGPNPNPNPNQELARGGWPMAARLHSHAAARWGGSPR